MNKPKVDFLTILHLSELYCEQYREKNYYLSPEQNDASFKDFVQQYYASLSWGETPAPVICPNVPLF